MEWSDVVLYASATVSLEALLLGIPVVYLDVDPFLNRDPLHDLTILKWHASRSGDIVKIFNEIERMDETEYSKKQTEALNYLKKYFKAVTLESMNKFLYL